MIWMKRFCQSLTNLSEEEQLVMAIRDDALGDVLRRVDEEMGHMQTAINQVEAARGAESFVPITAARMDMRRKACDLSWPDLVALAITKCTYGELMDVSRPIAQLIHPEEPIDDNTTNAFANALWKWGIDSWSKHNGNDQHVRPGSTSQSKPDGRERQETAVEIP